jgi:hypothetical protein
MMKQRIFKAFLLGLTLVVAARLFGSVTLGRLMLPGILVGSFVPGNGFGWEGEIHPWGLISIIVVYTVNIVLYSGLAYGLLSLIGSWRKKPNEL